MHRRIRIGKTCFEPCWTDATSTEYRDKELFYGLNFVRGTSWFFLKLVCAGFNEEQVAACHRNKISSRSLASDAVHGAAQTFFVQAFLKAECVGWLSDALGLVDCSDFHPGHKGIGGKLWGMQHDFFLLDILLYLKIVFGDLRLNIWPCHTQTLTFSRNCWHLSLWVSVWLNVGAEDMPILLETMMAIQSAMPHRQVNRMNL